MIGAVLRRPERQWWLRPLGVFVLSRLLLFGVAAASVLVLPRLVGLPYGTGASHNLLALWARWDSGTYLRIAEHGYSFIPGLQSSVAFFPVYPLLIRLMSMITGDVLVAGWLVSNLALLGGLVLLYRLTEEETGDAQVAARTITYLAFFPTSFFLNAVYTESVFLLLLVGTFYFARRREWGWSAALGVLCAAARPVGVLVWGVVGLEWLASHGWTLATSLRRAAWVGMGHGLHSDWRSLLTNNVIPLGLVSYMGFLGRQFEDPLAFWTTQASWGRSLRNPLAVLLEAGQRVTSGSGVAYQDALNVLALVGGLALLVGIWRRFGESYAVYSGLALVVPAVSGLGSMIRYMLVVFPCFMLLGVLGRWKVLDRLLVVSFVFLLAVLTFLFVNWLYFA